MKVVILAGGYGTRISEESQLKPKPMIEICDMPILWHIMKIYSKYNINDFVICCGYKGNIIKDELFKASFIHGVNVFDPGITNYLARSLGIRKEFQAEKSQQWVNKLIQEGQRKLEK